MYKLLMVDDEDIIRTGFRARIDWTAAGFEFLPPCANGQQAMAAIASLKPDVLITDICMPLADGLELSSWVRANHSSVTVVVLSGYDDFEYAQASIRNKVWDYVLKPVTAREIGVLLQRLKEKLDAERLPTGNDWGQQTAELRRFLSKDLRADQAGWSIAGENPENLSWIAVNIHIYGHDASEPEVIRQSGLLDDSLRPWLLLAFDTPSASGKGNSALLIEPGLLQSSLLPQRVRLAQAQILVYDPNPRRARQLAEFQTRRLGETLKSSGFGYAAGIGSVHPGCAGARLSAEEAGQAANYRLVGGEGIWLFESLAERTVAAAMPNDTLPERLCSALRIRDGSGFDRLLAELPASFASPGTSIPRIRRFALNLLQSIDDVLTQAQGKGFAAPNCERLDHGDIIDLICGFSELLGVLQNLGQRAMAAMQASGAGVAEQKILEFKAYVARNYRSPNLAITQVAHDLLISPSYLSKVLKRSLDVNFVNFITDFRLTRAKEFLASSSMKTYEVAEACGYGDYRYFSTVFKRMTGLSPSEYRAQLQSRA